MLLGTLDASLLGNLLICKEIEQSKPSNIPGPGVIRSAEGTNRAGEGSKRFNNVYGYFSLGFIDFMLKGTSLLDYTNLFSPNEYEKNDKTIKYFQQLNMT